MRLNVKFHNDDKTLTASFDQYIGGSSSVEVPTKLSELENDVGYITADDIPDIPEVPTKLSELENDTKFITADEVPESGVTSWNDLEDKPFGETDVGAWKEVGSGYTSETGNLISFAVNNITSNFEPIVGKKYKIVVTIHMSGTIESIGVARKKINPDYSESYVIGSDGDAIVWNKRVNDLRWVITLAEPVVSRMGVNVTIYEAEPAIIILDEKYIPDTIARKSDIPDVPTKLSEFENDAGFITADDIPEGGGGTVSWDDIEDKPFEEAPPLFDIQWDGNMDGRDTFGDEESAYLVKVSDEVYTAEQILGSTIYYHDGYNEVVLEEYVNTDIPGVLDMGDVLIVYSVTDIPDEVGEIKDLLSNGVWFVNAVSAGYYVNRFVSPALLDEKHIPDTIARKSDISKISGVPTKLSELENDIGYLTEADIPTVPSTDEIVDSVIASLPIYNGEVEEV